MEFYSLKNRQRVDVPESKIQKRKLERTTSKGTLQVRYQLVAELDGARMFKFVDQNTYGALNIPELG